MLLFVVFIIGVWFCFPFALHLVLVLGVAWILYVLFRIAMAIVADAWQSGRCDPAPIQGRQTAWQWLGRREGYHEIFHSHDLEQACRALEEPVVWAKTPGDVAHPYFTTATLVQGWANVQDAMPTTRRR